MDNQELTKHFDEKRIDDIEDSLDKVMLQNRELEKRIEKLEKRIK